jgi:hypothetical protein
VLSINPVVVLHELILPHGEAHAIRRHVSDSIRGDVEFAIEQTLSIDFEKADLKQPLPKRILNEWVVERTRGALEFLKEAITRMTSRTTGRRSLPIPHSHILNVAKIIPGTIDDTHPPGDTRHEDAVRRVPVPIITAMVTST